MAALLISIQPLEASVKRVSVGCHTLPQAVSKHAFHCPCCPYHPNCPSCTPLLTVTAHQPLTPPTSAYQTPWAHRALPTIPIHAPTTATTQTTPTASTLPIAPLAAGLHLALHGFRLGDAMLHWDGGHKPRLRGQGEVHEWLRSVDWP